MRNERVSGEEMSAKTQEELRSALYDAWIVYQTGGDARLLDTLLRRAMTIAGIGEITSDDIVEWQSKNG